MANTACEHSKEIVTQLKHALSNDEAARKESAASRESSGGIPDVGLASILRKQTMSETSNEQTTIDISNKLLQAEKNISTNNSNLDVGRKSLEDSEQTMGHKIYSHDNVTEMIENNSTDTSDIGNLLAYYDI